MGFGNLYKIIPKGNVRGVKFKGKKVWDGGARCRRREPLGSSISLVIVAFSFVHRAELRCRVDRSCASESIAAASNVNCCNS